MAKIRVFLEVEDEVELPLFIDANDLSVDEIAALIEGLVPQVTDWEIETDE